MTTKDIEKMNHEYLKKMNAIILHRLNNPIQSIPDMTPLVKSFAKNKFLSPNQQLEIDNIIEHFNVRW